VIPGSLRADRNGSTTAGVKAWGVGCSSDLAPHAAPVPLAMPFYRGHLACAKTSLAQMDAKAAEAAARVRAEKKASREEERAKARAEREAARPMPAADAPKASAPDDDQAAPKIIAPRAPEPVTTSARAPPRPGGTEACCARAAAELLLSN
jgi:hypothetical protein